MAVVRRSSRILALLTLVAACALVIYLLWCPKSPESTSVSPVTQRGAELAPALRGIGDGQADPESVLKEEDGGRTAVAVEVLDEDRSPRSGVDVYVTDVAQWTGSLAPVSDWPDKRGSTNPQGMLQVTVRVGESIVGVWDPEDGSSFATVCRGPLCRFILPRRRRFRLLVVSQLGEPVAEAAISLRSFTAAGRRFKKYAVTDSRGRLDIGMPGSERGLTVQGFHATEGYGHAAVAANRQSATLSLTGAHATNVLLGNKTAKPRYVDAWFVVRREGIVLWSSHQRIAAGSLLELGLVPHGSTVALLAFGDHDQVAHAHWRVTDPATREVPLVSGSRLRLRVNRPSSLRPLVVRILPPKPYLNAWGTFPVVADRFERILDGEDAVMFGGIPLLDGGVGRWRLVATHRGEPLSVSPLAFTLPADAGGDEHELTARIEEFRGVTIEGKTVDAVTSLPVQHVRIGLRQPGIAGLVAVSDGEGRYRLRTLLPTPLRVFFEASGYLPWAATAEPAIADGNPLSVDATLVPNDAENMRDIAVCVRGPDGGPVGGALCTWSLLDGTQVGQVVSSSNGTTLHTSLPVGNARLAVTPPNETRLLPYMGTHTIAAKDNFEVGLLPRPALAQVLVEIGGSHAIGDALHAFLMGSRIYSAPISNGRWARIKGVRVGRYSLAIRAKGGALLSMGSVDVEAPDTHVTRALDRLHRIVVVPDAPEADGPLVVLLRGARTGRILDSRPAKDGVESNWMLPDGNYVAEASSRHRHGESSFSVPSASAIKISLDGDAGNVALSFLAEGKGKGDILLSVRFEGPVVRHWESLVRFVEGRGQFEARGLPVGRYEVKVVTQSGATYEEVVDVAAGETVAVRQVRIQRN